MRYLFGLLALCGAAAAAETPGPVALRDARVVTVSGPTLERGAVLLRDGMIEAVGENLPIPADAWVIDGKGLTVYPGLIDALSVPGAPAAGAPAPAQRGAAPPPAVRGPEDRPSNASWVRAADAVNAADRRIEEARNAGFTTLVMFPGAGIFAGQGAVVNLAGEKRRMVVASPRGNT
jgi:cytosine/adenosine deaminase-related metal-dependent hydrolase